MREIGSEFQSNSFSSGRNLFAKLNDYDKKFVLSGRTALSFVADDLLEKANIKVIALPQYCCASMIYPFYEKGIHVIFYPNIMGRENISHKELSYIHDFIEMADAVLVMDYFGFVRESTFEFAKFIQEKGKKLIIDATQSAFSFSKTYNLSDYLVVSYRKWSNILCAVAYCKEGFSIKEYTEVPMDYLENWNVAADYKRQYLKDGIICKEDFLKKYSLCNLWLENNYKCKSSIDKEIKKVHEIDSDALVYKRRNNAQYIYENLKICNDVKFLFHNMENDDCPLFVPILVTEQKKKYILEELKKENIYCPAHWPIDERYPYVKTLYHNKEISLVCDQRYDIADMEREVYVLNKTISQ